MDDFVNDSTNYGVVFRDFSSYGVNIPQGLGIYVEFDRAESQISFYPVNKDGDTQGTYQLYLYNNRGEFVQMSEEIAEDTFSDSLMELIKITLESLNIQVDEYFMQDIYDAANVPTLQLPLSV